MYETEFIYSCFLFYIVILNISNILRFQEFEDEVENVEQVLAVPEKRETRAPSIGK